jgi:small subunit ribosomal protein S1
LYQNAVATTKVLPGRPAIATKSNQPVTPVTIIRKVPNSMSTAAVAEATQASPMESFAALFEESLQRQEMRAGEVITAEVVRIDQNFVVVNAGLKSESMIPVEEFHNERG